MRDAIYTCGCVRLGSLHAWTLVQPWLVFRLCWYYNRLAGDCPRDGHGARHPETRRHSSLSSVPHVEHRTMSLECACSSPGTLHNPNERRQNTEFVIHGRSCQSCSGGAVGVPGLEAKEIIALARSRFAEEQGKRESRDWGALSLLLGIRLLNRFFAPNTRNVIRYWPLCKNADEGLELKSHLQALHLATVCLKLNCPASVHQASLGMSSAIN